MKRVLGVAVSFAVALTVGGVLIHLAASPPASIPTQASAPPPVPVAPPIVLDRSVNGEREAAATGANKARTTAPPPQDLATLREEVALLRTQVTAFERWIHTQQRTVERVPQDREPALTPDPRTDSEARAAVVRERQHQMAGVEADFRREPANLRWAVQAEEAVQAALASDDVVQNSLLGLECRTQTCRVELAHDDTGELAKAMPLVLLQMGPTLPYGMADYVTDSAGGKTIILYLSREAPTAPGK